ncbi:NUDIX domain-containing protein [Sphingomonas sp.]|uniref:NUDIX hydrolase n=1 Tax=Sphingomonas sp. TaxID=28214 RepID=UPI001B06896F|nr:NUDIX domain-containing protein [Sphingomonas sp.]MBO9713365.1 NUDIX domain-containing protein [Sphingomonas sp.]
MTLTETDLAQRPAARILLLDGLGRLLLFRFTPADRPPFWATPGGAIDPGESYAEAARRELYEETGLTLECGEEVHRSIVQFTTLENVRVHADERYFLVRAEAETIAIDPANHTELEQRLMRSWHWFTRDELADWPETIFPEDIVQILEAVA